MKRRQSSSAKRVSDKSRNRKQWLAYEPLEKRDLLSTIAWTNRGGPNNDSDLVWRGIRCQCHGRTPELSMRLSTTGSGSFPTSTRLRLTGRTRRYG